MMLALSWLYNELSNEGLKTKGFRKGLPTSFQVFVSNENHYDFSRPKLLQQPC